MTTPDINFQPYMNISSAEMNDILMQIRDGTFQSSYAIRALLHGKIQFEDLAPELQALFVLVSNQQDAIGDGVTDTFLLSAILIGGTDTVYLNGLLQKRGADYTVLNNSIIFVTAPSLGDHITFIYRSAQAMAATVIASPVINHKQLLNTLASDGYLFVCGTNKVGLTTELARYDQINFSQIGPSININSGIPEYRMIARAGGYLWVIGAASGTNNITRVDPITLTSTVFSATADTGATAAAITTDGTYLYIFIKGGTYAPNSITKMDLTGTQVGSIASGFPPGPVGDIDMAISTAGFLFVSYTDSAQVRKYDTAPAGGLLNTFTFTNPIRLTAINSLIYVLEGTTSKMFTISATNVVSELIQFVFVPENITYDGHDMWISASDVIRKVDLTGTIVQTLTPIPTFPIKSVSAGLGSVWTSYTNDDNPGPNLSKIFPGLVGI
jgi:DNA-binding beta-propeller fold protein YncE